MRISSKSILFLFFFVIPFFVVNGQLVRAKNGMVVSASDIASKAGIEILKKGGNAIDAAVAVGYALAVTYPNAGNIGGGGFMVIHLADGKNTTIDFREKAPGKAHEKMFLDSLGNHIPDLSENSWLSAGIPGTVAGFSYALQKYGTMNIEKVIRPAINLADKGFPLHYRMAALLNSFKPNFDKIKSTRKIFTKGDSLFKVGDLFIQKDLAKTLSLISKSGKDAFYKGTLTKRIIDQSNKNGGIFSFNDFEDYETIEREPLIGFYRGYKIISMMPPSSGGVCLVEALNTLENYSFKKEDWNSSKYLHTLIEVMKRIYADRSVHMGDPDFYDVPIKLLTSKIYSHHLFKLISEKAANPESVLPADISFDYESAETTHFSVYDKYGNAVSVTYTLNGNFGNKIIVDGLGFFLNNEMDDFSSKPGIPNQFGLIGGKANSIQPGKRMLSSMTPTIILKDNKPFLIVGSPGGSTIITSVLQVILNVIDFEMNIYEAISAPRIHHQLYPNEIVTEKFGVPEDVKMNLIQRGHKFGEEKFLGRVEGILVYEKVDCIWGNSDKRAYGQAVGY